MNMISEKEKEKTKDEPLAKSGGNFLKDCIEDGGANVTSDKFDNDATANSAIGSKGPFNLEQIKKIRSQEKFRFYFVVKSVIDWIMAFIAFAVLLVPFLVIGIISFCTDPGTVFFLQTRCGRNGKPFKIIKFRTMKKGVIQTYVSAQDLTEKDYEMASNAWQKLLRKTSFDELPQVINILLGQMAFIGPRPLVYNESVVIDGRIKNGSIHCKPGLSGLAQVNGRRAVDYESKVYFDGKYYNSMNFTTDLKLWLKTIGVVFSREGAK